MPLIEYLSEETPNLVRRERERVIKELTRVDMILPGNCLYEHPVKTMPDIISDHDNIPTKCKVADIKEAIHYYNFCKFKTYNSVLQGQRWPTFKQYVNKATTVRTRCMTICISLWYDFVKKRPGYEPHREEGVLRFYRYIDRFDPSKGFSPSTFLLNCSARRSWTQWKLDAKAKERCLIHFENTMGRGDEEKTYETAFYDDTVDKATVAKLMSVLNEREKTVIRMRFYEEQKLADVGVAIGGVSKERVRQIEMAAIKKMRQFQNPL